MGRSARDGEHEEPHVSVQICPSLYRGRPGTVFFQYPKELLVHGVAPRAQPTAKVEDTSPGGGTFQTEVADESQDESAEMVTMSTEGMSMEYDVYWERNCVKQAFAAAGFNRRNVPLKKDPSITKGGKGWLNHKADVGKMFGGSNVRVYFGKHLEPESAYRKLHPLHRINTFPGSWVLGRKDRLARRLSEMQRLHGAAYKYSPEPYLMPRDYARFGRENGTGEREEEMQQEMQMQMQFDMQDYDPDSAEYRQAQVDVALRVAEVAKFWIIKPFGAACGRGIRVMPTSEVRSFSDKLVRLEKKREKQDAADAAALEVKNRRKEFRDTSESSGSGSGSMVDGKGAKKRGKKGGRRGDMQWLLQQYIARPLLVRNRKLDLRLYGRSSYVSMYPNVLLLSLPL